MNMEGNNGFHPEGLHPQMILNEEQVQALFRDNIAVLMLAEPGNEGGDAVLFEEKEIDNDLKENEVVSEEKKEVYKDCVGFMSMLNYDFNDPDGVLGHDITPAEIYFKMQDIASKHECNCGGDYVNEMECPRVFMFKAWADEKMEAKEAWPKKKNKIRCIDGHKTLTKKKETAFWKK